MDLLSMARRIDGIVPRRLIAAAATFFLSRKSGFRRQFSVDRAGHWVSSEGGITFVSPDIYTATVALVTERVLDYWTKFYSPVAGDVVVDVGAGIGEDAVVFSKMVGAAGRVIAIEAHPDTFACLQQTIARSGLANVTAIQCAVADADGELVISTTEQHLANSILPGLAGDGAVVPARSLDSLLTELDIDDVALLKMNIEGAERFAVRGMDRSAAGMHNLAISCHDFVAERGGDASLRTKDEVAATLRRRGFEIRQRSENAEPWLRDVLFARWPDGQPSNL